MSERGQATLEFLMVVPFVFVFLFFMAEGTNAIKQWMVLEGASREGARCGAVRKTTAQVQTCVINASGGLITTGNYSTYVTETGGADQGGTVGSPVIVSIGSPTGFPYSFAPTSSVLGALLTTYGGVTIPNLLMSAQTQMRLEEQTS